MKTEKRNVGDTGEDIVVKQLVKHGYKILDRNYSRKWGEIDVVAKKNKVLHFIEVKAVTQAIRKMSNRGVSYETFSPEDHVNYAKKQRLARIVQTYLSEKHVSSETPYQVDVAVVFLDFNIRKARISMIENIELFL